MITRLLLILVGSIATGLAILGVILPGLPTTPFLLVALWAFARSSMRLHTWLKRVPVLQIALREAERFEQTRSMHIGVKIFAFAMVWTSVALTTFVLAPQSPILIGAVIILALSGTVFLFWVNTDWE